MLLWGRFEAHPVRTCEAYNNLKHTQNSHHVTLDPQKRYLILKKHKGQYLVLLKGESPAQRWVDAGCFSDANLTKSVKHTRKYGKKIFANINPKLQSVLVLSWHNTFCEYHPRRTECRSNRIGRDRNDGHLVLHGLWPQPRNKLYCNVPPKTIARDKHHQWRALPALDLRPETRKQLESYMPGYTAYLHRHEWIKHGTCYGTDPDAYFHDALTLAETVDRSEVGDLLRRQIGQPVTLHQIQRAFARRFGETAKERIEMRCNGKLLSELWISLAGRGDRLKSLLAQAPRRTSRCRSAIVDPAGIQRSTHHRRRR
jgi:ribonuclease T2